jgi:hypothetical protein
MIEMEDENVIASAITLFQRILINTKDSIDYFLDGISKCNSPFLVIFQKLSAPHSPSSNPNEHYVSLLQSMCTTSHREIRDLTATYSDSMLSCFPALFSKSSIVQYSVSIQIKLVQILVFFGRSDTRILELINWEFYLSGFFDRFRC